jgi:K+-transporting ATPase ATPase C chain
MKNILRDTLTSIIATIIFAIILCGIYPVLIWGIGELVFPWQTNGSLLTDKNGQVIGSRLIGQNFTEPQYFHPRPSAAGSGYDPTSSGGTNLGPTSQKLATMIQQNIAEYRKENNLSATSTVPADAVTASASGLDPDISLDNAMIQAPRVAKARHLSLATVQGIIQQNIDPRGLGFLGEEGVNVLTLNIALDNLQAAQ